MGFQRRLPGFRLSMGYTISYLSILVLIPLALLVLSSLSGGWAAFWKEAFSRRVVVSYQVSLSCAAAAAVVNFFVGGLVAWTLVRYQFPGRRLLDALVDFPFALPTAVAGICFAVLFSEQGVMGQAAALVGLHILNTPLGITIALIFVGFPFVVRTLQPVLADLEIELEEAAHSLGAKRWTTFRRVIVPEIFPAALTGVTLAFSRAVGEYGSVIFIAGNLPFKTEITPLLIMAKLDQFDDAGAAAVALVLLAFSFVSLLTLNALQVWRGRLA